eukprot:6407306-Karenia_brevis.AAC.1
MQPKQQIKCIDVFEKQATTLSPNTALSAKLSVVFTWTDNTAEENGFQFLANGKKRDAFVSDRGHIVLKVEKLSSNNPGANAAEW